MPGTPNPLYEFALSPVRDSAGTKYIDLFVTTEPTMDGFASASLYEFMLTKDVEREAVSVTLMASVTATSR